MDALGQELERLFGAVKLKPRGFLFWREIHAYVALVRSNPLASTILRDSQAERHERFRAANAKLVTSRQGTRVSSTETIITGGPVITEKRITWINSDAEKQYLKNFRKTVALDDEENIFAKFDRAILVYDAVEELTRRGGRKSLGSEVRLSPRNVEADPAVVPHALMMGRFEEHDCVPMKDAPLVAELAAVMRGDRFASFKLRRIVKDTLKDMSVAHRLLLNEVAKRTLAAKSVPIETVNADGGDTTTSSVKQTETVLPVSKLILEKFSHADTWEQVRFEFGADGDRVEVFIQGESAGTYHFDDINFGKKSTSETTPVSGWKMLRQMAMLGGEITYDKEQQPTKKLLQERLKTLFPSLNGDPIVHDGTRNVYRSRIKMVDRSDKKQSFLDGDGPKSFLRPV